MITCNIVTMLVTRYRLLAPSHQTLYRTFSVKVHDTVMLLLPGSRECDLPWRYRVVDLRALQLRTVNSTRRPEHSTTEQFYTKQEVKRYLSKRKNIRIQEEMTMSALDLLQKVGEVDEPILDIGCGACISGKILNDHGLRRWAGIDSSHEMLKRRKSESSLGLVRGDIFVGLPFRDSSFGSSISISTLQWGFKQNEETIRTFFMELYRILDESGSAVVQFYPASYQDVELVMNAANVANFRGCLVASYPHGDSARKLFLCLTKKLLRGASSQ